MAKKLRKAELDELQKELLERKNKILEYFVRVDKDKEAFHDYHEAQDVSSKNDETAEGVSEMITDDVITDSYEKNLKDIDQALFIMEKGNYGKCKYCEKDIPIERLKARPTSTAGVECKPQFTN